MPFPSTLASYELAVDRALPGGTPPPPPGRVGDAFFRRTPPDDFAREWQRESRWFTPAEIPGTPHARTDPGTPSLFD